MDGLFRETPDAPTPLNSAGAPIQPYQNAAGDFDLKRSLHRKVKSREDLSQPKRENFTEDDTMNRYFGAFSIESKRHVWDLLKKHPQFGDHEPGLRLNRIRNNTIDVLPNDPVRTVVNGSHVVYQHPENNDADV